MSDSAAFSSPLGKSSIFTGKYNPELLCPLPRDLARAKLGISALLPFSGHDHWTCYELSWDNEDAIPQVAICRLIIPCSSPNLVESKSLKLYLNSFSSSRFESIGAVKEIIRSDLSSILKSPLQITIFPAEEWQMLSTQPHQGLNLDHLRPNRFSDVRDPNLLETDLHLADELLFSNLFRSFCPVTAQPDWASVSIKYRGPKIRHETLLAYLISLRNHHGFHEECAEMIFMDIAHNCKPLDLAICLNFTRRGGIEINPSRASHNLTPVDIPRLIRQ